MKKGFFLSMIIKAIFWFFGILCVCGILYYGFYYPFRNFKFVKKIRNKVVDVIIAFEVMRRTIVKVIGPETIGLIFLILLLLYLIYYLSNN